MYPQFDGFLRIDCPQADAPVVVRPTAAAPLGRDDVLDNRKEGTVSNMIRAEMNGMRIEEMRATADAYRRVRVAERSGNETLPSRSLAFVYRRALAAVALSVVIVVVLAGAALAGPMVGGSGASLPGQAEAVSDGAIDASTVPPDGLLLGSLFVGALGLAVTLNKHPRRPA